MRHEMSRTILGLLISPLAAPLTVYIALALAFPASGFSGGDTQFTSILVGLVSYIVCFVVGIPLYFVFQKHGNKHYAAYCSAGIIAGIVSSILVFTFFPGFLGDTAAIATVLAILAVAGFLVALSFWVIAVSEPNPLFNADAPKRRAG